MIYHKPKSSLFPYTTLFRSRPSGHVFHTSCDEQVAIASFYRPIGMNNRGKTATAKSIDCFSWHRIGQSRQQRCRSEEHTSELQSRPHIVCRLLLEKKNVFNI